MADLRSIAKAVPVLNRRAAQRQQEAQEYQFLGALAQGPTPPGGATAAAQAVAPQMAATAAGIQQQAAQATQTGLLEAGKAALAQEETAGRQLLGQRELEQRTALGAAERASLLSEQAKDISARKELTQAQLAQQGELARRGIDLDLKASFLTRKQQEDLAALGGNLDDELFNSRLQFTRDEAGRKFMNERQLEDWKISNAKNKVELGKTLREIKQQADFDVLMADLLSKKVQQKIEQEMRDAEQRGDLETTREISAMKAAFARKKNRAEAQSIRMNSYLETAVGVASAAAKALTGGAV